MWENLQYLVGIPFWFLYFKIVLILIKRKSKKEFSSVFYYIVTVTGIVDCTGFWLNQLINRWPSAPLIGPILASLFETPSHLVTPFYMGFYFTLYMSEFSGFILALNRFTNLTFPTKSEHVSKNYSNYTTVTA